MAIPLHLRAGLWPEGQAEAEKGEEAIKHQELIAEVVAEVGSGK